MQDDTRVFTYANRKKEMCEKFDLSHYEVFNIEFDGSGSDKQKDWAKSIFDEHMYDLASLCAGQVIAQRKGEVNYLVSLDAVLTKKGFIDIVKAFATQYSGHTIELRKAKGFRSPYEIIARYIKSWEQASASTQKETQI